MKENFNPEIELTDSIPENKFDDHMKAAHESSLESRQKVFLAQNEKTSDKKQKYSKIKSSVY